MNAQERKVFWETLCSLPGDNIEQEANKLISTIKLPKYLFRYRSVSLSSLEALRTNMLHFSSANYYDDPFDTFLHIDVDAIRQEFLSAFKTRESTETVVEEVKKLLNDLLTEERRAFFTVDNITNALSNGLTESFIGSALALRDEVKKDAWSVCFSENGFNEALWLKYADQHKGFVQIYDLENNENYLCGKQENCQNCVIAKFGAPIYPVYYSDTSYDATNLAKIVMLNKLAEHEGIQIPQYLYDSVGNGVWERERITLIKKKCHEYDEEWRMISVNPTHSPIAMRWIPIGVILGLRMGEKEENLVMSMAREAGIKSIFKMIINEKNNLAVSVKSK